MAQFLFSTIGRHIKCAIQTELVVELELALIERKQYRWCRHNSIICQEDTKGVAEVKAKVKGHAEPKIEKPRVKTFIYDFPKLHHSSPKSIGANVYLRQFFLNG